MMGSAAPTGAAAGITSDAARAADARTRARRPRRDKRIRCLLLGGPPRPNWPYGGTAVEGAQTVARTVGPDRGQTIQLVAGSASSRIWRSMRKRAISGAD